MRALTRMVCLALLLPACGDTPPATEHPPPPPPPPPPLCDGEKNTEAAPLQRLTRTQYNRTVASLIGYEGDASYNFPVDENQLGFDTGLTPASRLHAEAYFTSARDLAGFALNRILELSPCREASRECLEAFVSDFGRRAFRRPLTSEERSLYTRLLPPGVRNIEDVRAALRPVIEAMLQAPAFLYRPELGSEDAEGELRPLGGYELASRLSYFIWNSMPDDALLEAAEAGDLLNPAELELHARRMLEDPRAAHMAEDFVRQWLHLEHLDFVVKEPEVFPAYTTSLRQSAEEETVRFFQHVVLEGDGRLETLLNAPYSFVNAELASLYGIDGVNGDALTQQSLPNERRGLLTQASFLMLHAHPNQTSPVRRGYFVRQRLLCTTPPPPPDDVDTSVSPPTPGLSTRERFAEHSESPTCNGCHQLMDPIGFGFEAFDGLGQYREMEGGVAVDVSGEIVGTDVAGTFNGVTELASLLTGSEDVQRCMVDQWFRFAHRRPAGPRDACSIEAAFNAFRDSDFNFRELILATVLSDAFRHYRSPN